MATLKHGVETKQRLKPALYVNSSQLQNALGKKQRKWVKILILASRRFTYASRWEINRVAKLNLGSGKTRYPNFF